MNRDQSSSQPTDKRRQTAVVTGSRSAPIAFAPHSIPVGGHRTVVVRHVEGKDEAALYELYDELDTDDRYMRFFCAYRPTDEFIEKLAHPAPGEARVVAELVEKGHRQLVAEAGYSLLETGNGEFAMVVARDWRGWLGPYLLDLVIDIAAANHVPNLEVDVLTSNRRMLSLFKDRGCAFLEHDGWHESRMMVATGPDGLSWPPDHDQPRVLVETPTGRWRLEDAARTAGMQVITCGGPGQNPSCPALTGGECALVAGADAIVVHNSADQTTWDRLTQTHSATHPDIPVIVEAGGGDPHLTELDAVRLPAFMHFCIAMPPKVDGDQSRHANLRSS